MKKFEFIYFGQLLIASSDYIFLCLTFCLVKLPPTSVLTKRIYKKFRLTNPINVFRYLTFIFI